MFRCALVALVCAFCAPSAAHAAEILELGADGRARVVEDRFVPRSADLPAPPRAAAAATPRGGAARRGAATSAATRRTVARELKRLQADGRIDRAAYREYRGLYKRARALEEKLSGARLVEMGAVRRTLDAIAARGQLTTSRLPALFLTLERNIRWWSTGPLLSSGQRIGFSGSEIVWQYYRGQGIQIQVLGTFGKLNGLWGARSNAKMEALLDEMLALPVERAGGLAWEYYFTFNGGTPPWVSALAQGTGVQAISRAAIRLGRRDEVMPIALRALGIFETAPPEGVRVTQAGGAHYLIYSFAPGFRVLNGFAQAVIGLHDLARVSADPRARALYEEGERVVRRETPSYDTGAWSLYSRGSLTRESDLNYHKLVLDFLSGLCKRTDEAAYCTTAENFTTYLTEKPEVRVTTRRLRGATSARLRFRLSKISRVGVEVRRAGRLVLSRPAFVGARGSRYVGWYVPRKPGIYDVSVTAVDLAGNVGSTSAQVEVLKPERR